MIEKYINKKEKEVEEQNLYQITMFRCYVSRL